MNPTGKDQDGSHTTLLEDVFLNSVVCKKIEPEKLNGVELVGDSRDAGQSRADSSSLEQLVPLNRPTKSPASVSLISTCKEEKKKSIPTSESKKNHLCEEKHRQNLRLLFAPDEEVVEPASPQPTKPSLKTETQVKRSTNVDILETRLNGLSKRLLTMEANIREMNKRQLTLESNMDTLWSNTPF